MSFFPGTIALPNRVTKDSLCGQRYEIKKNGCCSMVKTKDYKIEKIKKKDILYVQERKG
jgi:hypothetical protein